MMSENISIFRFGDRTYALDLETLKRCAFIDESGRRCFYVYSWSYKSRFCCVHRAVRLRTRERSAARHR